MNVSSNLLSAVSLALAALAVFYSLWWPDIEAASNLEIPPHFADRGPATRIQEAVIRSKALPIATASLTVAVLTAPPAVDVLVEFVRSLSNSGWHTFNHYSAIQALFVTVWIGTVLIAVSTFGALRSIRANLRELRKK